MALAYRTLPVALLPAGARVTQPAFASLHPVTFASPAREAMTDFTQVPAVTVEPETDLDMVELRMKYTNVRLLFVLDARRNFLGLVTLNDIKGERPIRFEHEMGVNHAEVTAVDVMTPLERLEAMDMRDVEDARVGDVLQTLKRTGRQHALVTERTRDGARVRGLFSATRIGRQLGVTVMTSGIAYTFAELEAALAH